MKKPNAGIAKAVNNTKKRIKRVTKGQRVLRTYKPKFRIPGGVKPNLPQTSAGKKPNIPVI